MWMAPEENGTEQKMRTPKVTTTKTVMTAMNIYWNRGHSIANELCSQSMFIPLGWIKIISHFVRCASQPVQLLKYSLCTPSNWRSFCIAHYDPCALHHRRMSLTTVRFFFAFCSISNGALRIFFLLFVSLCLCILNALSANEKKSQKDREWRIGKNKKNFVKWIWINKYSIWQLTKIFYIINVIAPFRVAFEREWDRIYESSVYVTKLIGLSIMLELHFSGSSSRLRVWVWVFVYICVCAHVFIPTTHHIPCARLPPQM